MSGLRDIQRRIRSVKKTQQITSAMRMVAAAKLRRAQDAIIAARPYAKRMQATLTEIGKRESTDEHVLLQSRDVNTLEVAVITSDRGLCGAFNANVIKVAEALIKRRAAGLQNLVITPVGRKASEYFHKHHGGAIGRSWSDLGTIGMKSAIEIAGHLQGRFVEGACDEVVVVYSKFVSAMVQNPIVDQLLPLAPLSQGEDPDDADTIPFEVEPEPKTVLGALLPRAIEFSIYRALLENQAGEHAARMAAMESATRNTEEMIDSLTLKFNRARQAAITKELVEIVTGAQALE